MASKFISVFPRSRPWCESLNSLDHSLPIGTVISSKVARIWPRSASLSSVNLHLHVHLQTHSITASNYISKFTQSRCDETAELSQYRERIRNNEQLWREEYRKRVRGHDGVLGCEEPHKLRRYNKAWQECLQTSVGKDRLCISYNEMMSI